MRDAADDLALDDHRIDDAAAIVLTNDQRDLHVRRSRRRPRLPRPGRTFAYVDCVRLHNSSVASRPGVTTARHRISGVPAEDARVRGSVLRMLGIAAHLYGAVPRSRDRQARPPAFRPASYLIALSRDFERRDMDGRARVHGRWRLRICPCRTGSHRCRRSPRGCLRTTRRDGPRRSARASSGALSHAARAGVEHACPIAKRAPWRTFEGSASGAFDGVGDADADVTPFARAARRRARNPPNRRVRAPALASADSRRCRDGLFPVARLELVLYGICSGWNEVAARTSRAVELQFARDAIEQALHDETCPADVRRRAPASGTLLVIATLMFDADRPALHRPDDGRRGDPTAALTPRAV